MSVFAALLGVFSFHAEKNQREKKETPDKPPLTSRVACARINYLVQMIYDIDVIDKELGVKEIS